MCLQMIKSIAIMGVVSMISIVPETAGLSCASRCKVTGIATSVVTVGKISTFTVQAIDSYGAVDTDPSQIFRISAIHTTENITFNMPVLSQPGCVNRIAIINSGYGCTSPGTLAGNGGGGTGFSATFQVAAGTISNVVVTNEGYGYDSKPRIVISSGGIGCAGFYLDPIMSLPGDFYASFITTVSGIYRVKPVLLQKHGLYAEFYNNPDFQGSPLYRVIDESIEYDGRLRSFASINEEVFSAFWDGALKIDVGPYQPLSGLGRSVSVIEVLRPGSGCTSTGLITSSGGGGTGLLASFSLVSYYGYDDVLVTGIGTVTLLHPGTGYSAPPDVVLISNNTGCEGYRFQATLTAEGGVPTTFYIETDGWVKLWVDNQIIIQNWNVPTMGLQSCRSRPELCMSTVSTACDRRGGTYRMYVDDNGLRNIYSHGCPEGRWAESKFWRNPLVQNLTAKVPSKPIISSYPIKIDYHVRVDIVGMTKNGVPLYSGIGDDDPVAQSYPDFDSCGGRVDDYGRFYYSQNLSCLYEDNPNLHSPLIGFMIDGIPLYGPRDVNGIFADQLQDSTKLDRCNGHIDSENRFYHYHAKTSFPYLMNCLMGCVSGSIFSESTSNKTKPIKSRPCIPSKLQFDFSKLMNLTWVSAPKVTDPTHRRVWTGIINLRSGGVYPLSLMYSRRNGAGLISLKWKYGYGATESSTGLMFATHIADCDSTSCANASLIVQPGKTSAQNTLIMEGENISPQDLSFDDSFISSQTPYPVRPSYRVVAGLSNLIVFLRDDAGNLRNVGGDLLSSTALYVISKGQCQDATANYIILANNAEPIDSFYDGMMIEIVGGSGFGQRTVISSYLGSSRKASGVFNVVPDTSSLYFIGIQMVSTVQDQRNGTYNLYYDFSISGLYSVWILLGGNHAGISPLYVKADPSRFDPSNSVSIVPYVWRTGEKQNVLIIAKDRFGNNISSPGLNMEDCGANCHAYSFTVIVRQWTSSSKISAGRIASSGDNVSFSLESSSSMLRGQYVGMVICAGGFTRTIIAHGGSKNSSSNDGRVITVDYAFPYVLAVGTSYYVSKVSNLSPSIKSVCRPNNVIGRLYKLSCPAILETGDYTVETMFSGRHVINSPINVTVVPSWSCASNSYAVGVGLTLSTAGRQAMFVIKSRDSTSQLRAIGGDSFCVTSDQSGLFSGGKVCSGDANLESISDLGFGLYAVSYNPTKSGYFFFNVYLGNYLHIHGSPFSLQVQPASICSVRSIAYGSGLTVATIAAQSRFVVAAKDAFDNNVEFLDTNSQFCDANGVPGSCLLTFMVGGKNFYFHPRNSGFSNGLQSCGWDVSYTISSPISVFENPSYLWIGNNSIMNRVSGGIYATYYFSSNFSNPFLSSVESSVDFSGSGVLSGSESSEDRSHWPWSLSTLQSQKYSITLVSPVSARWSGMLKPPVDGAYSFCLKLGHLHDRVKLWVDNVLLIDQWSSLVSLFPMTTSALKWSGTLYDLSIEYKTSSTTRRMSLYWNYNYPLNMVAKGITSDRLFRVTPEFNTRIYPAGVGASFYASASGSSLTLTTVGQSNSFTIRARDQVYGMRSLNSTVQRFSFTARTGKMQGYLFATYYNDADGMKSTNVKSSTRLDPGIYLRASKCFLMVELSEPTQADSAEIVEVSDSAALNTAPGWLVQIDDEVVKTVKILNNSILVFRGQLGTVPEKHLIGAEIFSLPTQSMVSVSHFSVRWQGFLQPQYSEIYTYFVSVSDLDERVKLWVDEVLLVDAWSSISSTALNATWLCPKANGLFNIEAELKNSIGAAGISLFWESASVPISSISTNRLFASSSRLHATIMDLDEGHYLASYSTTVSGRYQSMLTLNTAGGLSATYFSDVNCKMYAMSRIDQTIDFDWGIFSPSEKVPADSFCVKWAGMIRSNYSDVHTFILQVHGSARLWIDDDMLIDTRASPGSHLHSEKIQLLSNVLYSVKLKYIAGVGKAMIRFKWRSDSFLGNSISAIISRPHGCMQQEAECLEQRSLFSGGMNYVDGDIVVRGGKRIARATFTVDSVGSLTETVMIEVGDGFRYDPSPIDFDIFFPDSSVPQTGSITSITVRNGGVNFVAGHVAVSGGLSPANGSIEVDKAGRIIKVDVHNPGSGFLEIEFDRGWLAEDFRDGNIMHLRAGDVPRMGIMPGMFVLVDYEVFLVNRVSNDILYVTGAQAGSSTSLHANGQPVVLLRGVSASAVSETSAVIYLSPFHIVDMEIVVNNTILIDDEVMQVIQVSSSSITVARGQAGSVATAHRIQSLITVLPRNGAVSISVNGLSLYLNHVDFNQMDIAVGDNIQVDQEIMLVKSMLNGNISVVRGQAGSVALPHGFGAIVRNMRNVVNNYMTSASTVLDLSPSYSLALAITAGDYVGIASEVLVVTDVTGGTLSVLRGQAESVASIHEVGSQFTLIRQVLPVSIDSESDVVYIGPADISRMGIFKGIYLKIDEEIMEVTDVLYSSLSVLRGMAGTTVSAHTRGTFIYTFAGTIPKRVSANDTQLYWSPRYQFISRVVSGTFVKVTTEVFLIKDIFSSSLEVIRAQAGTQTASHPVGSLVKSYRNTLVSSITSSANLIYLSPYDIVIMQLNPGSLLKIDDEIVSVITVNISAGTLTVSRAHSESLPQGHMDGALCTALVAMTSKNVTITDTMLYTSVWDLRRMNVINNTFIRIDAEVMLIIDLPISLMGLMVVRGSAGSTISSHLFGTKIMALRFVTAVPMTSESTSVGLSPADITLLGIQSNTFIKIDNEVMLVTGVLGGMLTVVRALAETFADFHSQGSSVIVSKGSLIVPVHLDTSIVYISPEDINYLGIVANGLIQIDLEIMLVTSVSTGSVSVLRAQAGSFASAHREGAPIFSLRGVLAATVNSSDLAIYVNPIDVLLLGIRSNVIVQIDLEKMLVTAVADGTLTVVRGHLSTIPTEHLLGSLIQSFAVNISGDVTAADNTVKLNAVDVSGLGISAGRLIKVDSETLLVTAVSGDIATVSRGQYGTIASDHQSGSMLTILFRVIADAASSNTTTIYLSPSDVSAFGLVVNCFLKIDSEIILVESISGGSLAVLRGQAGTSSSSHRYGALITPLAFGAIAGVSRDGFTLYINVFEMSYYADYLNNSFIKVDDEIMLVRNMSSSGLSVLRCQAGTYRGAHSFGAKFTLFGAVAANMLSVESDELWISPSFIERLSISNGSFIKVDSEILLVLSVLAGRLQVQRGQAGSTRDSHFQGAAVSVINDGLAIDLVRGSNIAFVSPIYVFNFEVLPGTLIRIDEEILLVNSIHAGTMYVARAQASSVEADHRAGALVQCMRQTLAMDLGLAGSNVILSPLDVLYMGMIPKKFIKIDNEVMLIENVSEGNMTVTRGQANTAAAVHLFGATVVLLSQGIASSIDSITSSVFVSPSDVVGQNLCSGLLIMINSEIMQIVQVTGSLMTLLRGQANSTASDHFFGSSVIPLDGVTASYLSIVDTVLYLSPIDMVKFEIVAQTFVKVDDEIILVESVSGSTLYISRAQAGSVASAHKFGAALQVMRRVTPRMIDAFSTLVYLSPIDILLFGIAPSSWIKIDDEIMLVTGVSKGAMKVVRGEQQSASTDHNAGALVKVLVQDRLSPFPALDISFSDTGLSQLGSITSLDISGNMTLDNPGVFDATVVCQSPCTGVGFRAQCSVREGIGFSIRILSHGSGYNIAYPPNVTCPGLANLVIFPNIAAGAVLFPNIAFGATLKALRTSSAVKALDSSSLYALQEPIIDWVGNEDLAAITVLPLPVCGSSSTVTVMGPALSFSVATVGSSCTFYIQARDQYGNVCSGPDGNSTTPDDEFVIRLAYSADSGEILNTGLEVTSSPSTQGAALSVLQSSDTSKAGLVQLQSALAVQGGLCATYYFEVYDPDGTSEGSHRRDAPVVADCIDRTIDFSSNGGIWPSAPQCLAGPASFSATWAGFIKHNDSTLFGVNFAAALSTNYERIRMWLSNTLVIDQWSSLSSITPSSQNKSAVLADTLYSIRLDYRTASWPRQISLKWDANGSGRVIPSTNLYRSYGLQSNIVLERMIARDPDGDSSFLTGSCVTLSTAFVTSSFIIFSRDAYQNSMQDYSDPYVVMVLPSSGSAVHGTVYPSVPGNFNAVYTVTTAGLHTLSVSYPRAGGLHATYFTEVDLTSATDVRVDDMTKPLISSNTNLWPGRYLHPMPRSNFSVRWEGFLKPILPLNYGFSTTLANTPSRLRMWIDNNLIIDQWTSLSILSPTGLFAVDKSETYFSIKIEYKFVSSTQGNAGLTLQWYSSAQQTVVIDTQGCIIGCINSMVSVSVEGSWATQTASDAYLATYLNDGNQDKGSLFVKFTYPKAKGIYIVQIRHPSNSLFDSAVPLKIKHAGGISNFILDQSKDGGSWVTLGTFAFDEDGGEIIIQNTGTTRAVAVDVVRFLRTALSNEIVLDSGLVGKALSARSFSLTPQYVSKPRNKDDTFHFINKRITIKKETRTILTYGEGETISVDSAFSIGSTLLFGNTTAVSSVITILSAAEAGIIPGRWIEIDFEIMQIVSVPMDTQAVVLRGQHGSFVQAHLNGSIVRTVLLPGTIVDSGLVSSAYSMNTIRLASSAPLQMDWCTGFELQITFDGFQQTRSITSCSDSRNVTVHPSFDAAPISNKSTYQVISRVVYMITSAALQDSTGDDCIICGISPSLLFTAPRVVKSLLILPGLERAVQAIGPSLTLATAGVYATFNVTVKDRYGSFPPDNAIVFVNSTCLVDTHGYGTTFLISGTVVNAADRYSITIGNVSSAVENLYLGYNITVGGETRIIVHYSADRLVQVNIPFSQVPVVGSKFTISSTSNPQSWFSGVSTGMNPTMISYMVTRSGTYSLSVQIYRAGGLQGNYFHNPWLQGIPSVTRVDPKIEFQWGLGRITSTASDYVGIRWNGLLSTNFSEVYTFFVNSSGFGPRLRINGIWIIDFLFEEAPCSEYDRSGQCVWYQESEWSAMDLLNPSEAALGTILLSANTMYDFQLEYRTLKGAASIHLFWKSPRQAFQYVPSSSLYYAFERAQGSPFLLQVRPSSVSCALGEVYTTDISKKCTLFGSIGSLRGTGLTIATAGMLATFDFISRDQYGNMRDSQSSYTLSRISGNASCGESSSGRFLSGLCLPRTDISPLSIQTDELFRFSYVAVLDTFGGFVSVSELQLGGLFATYYSTVRCPVTGPKESSGVRKVRIVSIGSECTQDGILNATGGGPGFGFSAKFYQRFGSVHHVIILNAGYGYDSPPKIAIVPPTTCVGVQFEAAMQFLDSDETWQSVPPNLPNAWWSSGIVSAGATLVDCGVKEPFRVLVDQVIDFSGSAIFDSIPISDWPNISPSSIEFYGAGLSSINGVYYRKQPLLSRVNSSYPYYVLKGDPLVEVGLTDAYFSIGGGFKIAKDGVVMYSSISSLAGPWIAENGSFPAPLLRLMPSPNADDFVVRWAGFIAPPLNGTYTFQAKIGESDERLKLWIDNSLLIDQWNSLATLSPSSQYDGLDSTLFYSVQVLYSDSYSKQVSRLSWKYSVQAMSVIPSSNLYFAFHAKGSPSTLHVHPSFPCSATSTATGIGLSLATAGMYATFSITAKDAYSNVRPVADTFGYRYIAAIDIADQGTAFPVKDDFQNFYYNITSHGSVILNAFVARVGGLQATYFGSSNFTNGIYTQLETVLDFSGSYATPTTWPGTKSLSIVGVPFSARWSGFVSPPYANIYTFRAQLSDASQTAFSSDTDERIRVWLDNQLILDQWTSIAHSWPFGTFQASKSNSMHKISIDFKSYGQNRRFSLYWESEGSYTAAACNFFSPAPYPPNFYVDICGWRLDSTCDAGLSICTYPTRKLVAGDFPNTTGLFQLGKSVVSAGDLDDDGVNDVVIGAPGDSSRAGRIYLVFQTLQGSPKDIITYPAPFAELYSPNSAAGDGFGNAMCVVGDLDRNGLSEIAIGAIGLIYIAFMEKGSALSSCTVCPPILNSWEVLNITTLVGSVVLDSLACVPDLDGDGTPEIAVGNTWDNTGGNQCGSVYILFLSTATCQGSSKVCLKKSIKYADGLNGFHQNCGSSAAQFGSSLAWIGDVNGDNVGDLGVGAKGDDCGGTDKGAVWILLLNRETWTVRESTKLCSGMGGLDASILVSNGCEFGASVSAVGDINGDGIPDLAVGSPKTSVTSFGSSSTWRGAVHFIVLTRAGTATAVKTWGGTSQLQLQDASCYGFGTSISFMGDHNRDGMYPDLIVGCAFDNNYTGSVMLMLSSSWSKWKSDSNTDPLTGPATPLSGKSIYFLKGKSCADGTRYQDLAGNRDNNQYSYLFKGIHPDCESACSGDNDCNFYTIGSQTSITTGHNAGTLVTSFTKVISNTISSRSPFVYISAQDISAVYLALNKYVKIDDEITLVTNISGNLVSVARAQAGSLAATHMQGAAFTVLHNALAAPIFPSLISSSIFISPADVINMALSQGTLIQIGNEIMMVIGVNGGIVSVERAHAGTSAGFHEIGATVVVVAGVASVVESEETRVFYSPFSSANFADATAFCSVFQMTLVGIDSDTEYQLVRNLMAKQGFSSILLGIWYQSGWVHADRTPLRYSSWAAGEPLIKECVSMISNGYWKGIHCSALLPFFCSKEELIHLVYISPVSRNFVGILENIYIKIGGEIALVVGVANTYITIIRAQAGTTQIQSVLYGFNVQVIASFSLATSISVDTSIIYLNPLDTVSMGLYMDSFVKVDDEVMLINAFATGVLAVSRGQGGTSSTSHNAGALAVFLGRLICADLDAISTSLCLSPADIAAMNIEVNTFVQLDDEILLVSHLSGSNLTVSRGMAASTASGHYLGAAFLSLRRVLAAATDASSTTLYISPIDIAAMGIITNTYIQIDAEIMRVTAVSGGTLSVSRGQSASTAASHAFGTLVQSFALSVITSVLISDQIINVNVLNVSSVGIRAGILLKIENELLLVTASSSNSVAVMRAQTGTAAAAHPSGTMVSVVTGVTAVSMTLSSTMVYMSPADILTMGIVNNTFIQIDSEVMLIMSVADAWLAVVRSQAASIASIHAFGSLVFLIPQRSVVSGMDTILTTIYVSPITVVSMGIVPNIYIAINSEVLTVSAVSANLGELTVIRGQAGTAASTHKSGSLVYVLSRCLASMMSSSSTTLFVSAAFIASSNILANRLILVDSELMLVQSVSGSSLAVMRGQAGTSIAIHLFGAAVYIVPSSALAVSCNSSDSVIYMSPIDIFNKITVGQFIKIDNEIMLVLTTSGSVVSVLRGSANTDSAVHIAGASVLPVNMFSLVAPITSRSRQLYMNPADIQGLGILANTYISVDTEIMKVQSNFSGALSISRGQGRACMTTSSCDNIVNNSDQSSVTYQKVGYFYLNSNFMGNDSSPGTAEFVSPPGYYSSISFWYHMYGNGMGSLNLEVMSHFEPVCSGLVLAVSSALVFQLDASASLSDDSWRGMLITISGETRTIVKYLSTRQVTIDSSFSFQNLFSGFAYFVRRKLSTCFTPSDCSMLPQWTQIWSVTGAQQRSKDAYWTQHSMALQGYAQPMIVRLTGVRGTNVHSYIGLDRIRLSSFSGPALTNDLSLQVVPFQIVPSSNLYDAAHIAGSPFNVTVRPDRVSATNTLCLSGCDDFLQITSTLQNLTITLVDSWGNERSPVLAYESSVPVSRPNSLYLTNHEDGISAFVQSLSNQNERVQLAFTMVSGSVYLGSYALAGLDETGSVNTFAVSSLEVRVLQVGGLRAVYHRGVDLLSPALERIDAIVDFSTVESPPGAGDFVPSDFFSVRWQGMVRPLATEACTFMTRTSSSPGSTGGEGVRLRATGLHLADLSLLIDAWDGPASVYTATIQFESGRLYDIELDYRDTYGSSRLTLFWSSESTGGAFVVVPSERLYSRSEVITGSPVSITVF